MLIKSSKTPRPLLELWTPLTELPPIHNQKALETKPTTFSQPPDKDLKLVSKVTVLPKALGSEIKDGFFELKQKFKQVTSAVYISHLNLHQKHPVF